MFEGIKGAIGRLFSSAGLPATAEAIDLGPGISANTSGGWYGYADGGDGSGWPFGLYTGSEPLLEHALLRQNARVAYHDSITARGVVDRFADITPGVGLKFESLPKYELLGLTPEAAEMWGTQVSEAFDTYMSSKTFSLTEDQNGYQSQRLVTIMQYRDGEYFARLSYSASRRLLNPLQVAFLDPAQIQGDTCTDTTGMPYVADGIIYDAVGRETGYKILTHNYSTNEQKAIEVPKYGRRSGRLMMIHGWQKEYPGQLRGYSRLAHALQSFKNLTDFEYAHIRKAVNDAAITMYVKPSKDRPASNPFEDYAAGPAGPYQAPQATSSTTDDGVFLDYSATNTVNLRPDSVGVFNLNGGEDLAEFKGSTPADNYAEFETAFVKSLASSMSMPVEALWMQFGQNYSASRATLVLLWQVVVIWRNEMIADYLGPILEMWLSGEIAAGRIKAPGWSDPRMRQAWMAGSWIGFPMPSIDPLKSAKADAEYVKLGATTLDRVAREYNGSNGRTNRAKLEREMENWPYAIPQGGGPQVPQDDVSNSNTEDSE